MKRTLLITYAWGVVFHATAQCGREYPSGFWHNSLVVLTSGDTINRRDSEGLYHGPHVYSMDRDSRMDDTTSYIFGHFEHGHPVGDWIDHCSDGSWSNGPFSMGGGEGSPGPDGKYVTRQQGLYCKEGLWRSYDRDSTLVRTLRYLRSKAHEDETVWRNRQQVLDAEGRWRTIEYIRNGPGDYTSHTHERVERFWQDDGTPIERFQKRKHMSSRTLYFDSGKVKSKNRCGWSLWYFHHRCVTRTWSMDGKLIDKRVTVRPQAPATLHRDPDDLF